MKKAKFIFLFVGDFIFLHMSAFAWSIIVVDPKTKQIGIAGASCTQGVYGIGAIYPGEGAVVVQANE
ncbi:MAG: hypothetical protein ABI480_00250 [Chitinophagaceae bacterium]